MSVIGIDIDGTLAASAAWVSGTAIGAPSHEAAELVKALHREGHHLYAWSCRADYVIRQYLRDNGLEIYFMGVNSSSLPSDSQKVSLDFYIGDDAVRWAPGKSDEILTLIRREGSVPTKVIGRDMLFSDGAPKPYYAGVGKMFVDMFEEEWRKAWRPESGWSFGRRFAFLTICSHAKPYSKSFIHTSIRKELHYAELFEGQDYDYVHISNAGIIPADAEMRHPFNAYDWNGENCSPMTTQYHVETIERRFQDWLTEHSAHYDHVVIYLRDGGNTCGAVERVLDRNGGSLPVALVKASALESNYPEFVRVKDPDDCLTHHDNLRKLINAFDRLRG